MVSFVDICLAGLMKRSAALEIYTAQQLTEYGLAANFPAKKFL
jgi:hypothetical protein